LSASSPRRQTAAIGRYWTTWSPAMTVRAADVTRFIHHGGPKAGAELAMTFVAVMEPMPSWLVWPFKTSAGAARRSQTMDERDKDDGIHVVEEDNISPPPHYRPDGPPQVVTSDTARQGPRGTRVFLVLAGSLVAAGVAWIVIAAFYGHGL
jgi:hypothetical protein